MCNFSSAKNAVCTIIANLDRKNKGLTAFLLLFFKISSIKLYFSKKLTHCEYRKSILNILYEKPNRFLPFINWRLLLQLEKRGQFQGNFKAITFSLNYVIMLIVIKGIKFCGNMGARIDLIWQKNSQAWFSYKGMGTNIG